MGSKQIRVSQIIAPFGPGSIYTDRRGTPHVVCGLDHWFKRSDPSQGLVCCEKPAEFYRFEPRLAELLHVNRFCSPPDFRLVQGGQAAPPNALLHVPALRFPCWYRHTATGLMRRFNPETTRIENPPDGGRWQPVRFVAVCAGGHLCEFPWKQWIGCECLGDGSLHLTDRGGSELSSIRVECRSCPPGSPGRKGKSLARTTIKPVGEERSAFQKAGITCSGDRPWLGAGANQPGCPHPLVGALINQTNLYFPKTMSSIYLPDLQQDDEITRIRNEIEKDPGICGIAKTLWNMDNHNGAVVLIQAGLTGLGITCEADKVEKALESIFAPAASITGTANQPLALESEFLAFRRAEFNIIRNTINDPDRIENLRVIPATVPSELTEWLSKVNMVERLRETRVFFGFSRLEPDPHPLQDMPDAAMHQLFRHPPPTPQERWIPAVEVFGEGIYLELKEDRLIQWQEDNAAWLNERLDDAFITRLAGIFQTLPPLDAASRNWASRYLLVHSLAHILINQLVFECGYSTASLRERLYVSADDQGPMAGILIYTAAGDSEGTLGGLVRLARPERLVPIIRRAISRASWCSADPVCSESLGSQGSRLANLAACHACILLPETSCETINHGLDRAMVVGLPENRQPGFMASLI